MSKSSTHRCSSTMSGVIQLVARNFPPSTLALRRRSVMWLKETRLMLTSQWRQQRQPSRG